MTHYQIMTWHKGFIVIEIFCKRLTLSNDHNTKWHQNTNGMAYILEFRRIFGSGHLDLSLHSERLMVNNDHLRTYY